MIYYFKKGKPFQGILSPNNLTSDTSNPEWELLSDSVFSSSYPMYKAFDGKPGGYLDGWLSAEVSGDHWLGIRHVGSPVRVTAYGFYPAWSGGNDAPKTWVFQGSHNGTAWETLDSQTDVSVPMESKEYKYTLASPAEYEYYRLYVTANQGGHTYLAIGEFILYGGLTYPTSSGFTASGKAIGYRSAKSAGCAFSRIPTDGMVFNAPFAVESSTAETGQAFTVTGTPVYEIKAGVPCVSFDGTNYMTFPDTGMPSGTSARTLSCWFYCDSLATYNNPILFGYGTRAATQFCGLFIQSDLSISFSGYSAANNLNTDANAVSVGKWHHLLATKSGTEENIYVDGVLVKSGTSGKNTVLGTGQIADTTDSDKYCFDGSLAGCRIYNRALSAEEISELATEFTPVKEPVLISPNNLTSNTSNPEWEAFSSTLVSGAYSAYKAFDGNLIGTGTGAGFLSANTPAHVGIRHIDSPVTVTAYGVCPWIGSGGVGNCSPTSWEFQGSQDGSEWMTLDSQTDISLATSGTEYKYPLASPAEYEYYRLLMKTTDNRNSWKGVGELMLYGYQE